MKFISTVTLITSLFLSSSFSAVQAEATASQAGIEKFTKALAHALPDVKPSKISSTPISGLYEVVLGAQVVYISEDARYMTADIVDLTNNTKYSENTLSGIRLKALDQLGEDNMIVYKPDDVKNTITVITDINCGYCRRLHDDMPKYLENNVEVRYIFLPQQGDPVANVKRTVSVWCSDDQQLALDLAKAGGEVEEKTCDNPILEHRKFAHKFGVRGTPAVFFDDGRMHPGYLPVNKMIAQIRK